MCQTIIVTLDRVVAFNHEPPPPHLPTKTALGQFLYSIISPSPSLSSPPLSRIEHEISCIPNVSRITACVPTRPRPNAYQRPWRGALIVAAKRRSVRTNAHLGKIVLFARRVTPSATDPNRSLYRFPSLHDHRAFAAIK